MPGLKLKSTLPFSDHEPVACQQHLLIYEPGDATRYEASLSWARFAHISDRLTHPFLDYLQFSVWEGSGQGNGTMLIESTGDHGMSVEDLGRIEENLRCSRYSAQVFSILIHGCLASHDLSMALDSIQHFREAGRLGFVDPDAAD